MYIFYIDRLETMKGLDQREVFSTYKYKEIGIFGKMGSGFSIVHQIKIYQAA